MPLLIIRQFSSGVCASFFATIFANHREARASHGSAEEMSGEALSLRAKYHIFVWPAEVCVRNSVIEMVQRSSEARSPKLSMGGQTIAPGDDFDVLVHLYDSFHNRIAQGGELLEVAVQGMPVSGKVVDFANGIYKVSCKLSSEIGVTKCVRLTTCCCKEGVVTVRRAEDEWEDMWAELTEEHTFSIFRIRNGERCLPAFASMNMNRVRVQRSDVTPPNDPNSSTHFELEFAAAGTEGSKQVVLLHLCCRRLEETLRWIAILRRVSAELSLPTAAREEAGHIKIEDTANTISIEMGVRGERLPGSPFSIAITQQQQLPSMPKPITPRAVSIDSSYEPESTEWPRSQEITPSIPAIHSPVRPPLPPVSSTLEQSQANDHSVLALHHRLAQQFMQTAEIDHHLRSPHGSEDDDVHHRETDRMMGSTATPYCSSKVETELFHDDTSRTVEELPVLPPSTSNDEAPSSNEARWEVDETERTFGGEIHGAHAPMGSDFDSTVEFMTPRAHRVEGASTTKMTMTYPGHITPAERRRRRLKRSKGRGMSSRPSRQELPARLMLVSRPSFKITKSEGWESLESSAHEASAVRAEAALRARSRSPEWRKSRIPNIARRARSKSPVLSRHEQRIERRMEEVNRISTERASRRAKRAPDVASFLGSNIDSFQIDIVERLRTAKRLAIEGLISRAIFDEIKENIVFQLKHGLTAASSPVSPLHGLSAEDSTKPQKIEDIENHGVSKEKNSYSGGHDETLNAEQSEVDWSSYERAADSSDEDVVVANPGETAETPSGRSYGGGYGARIPIKGRGYNHTPLAHDTPFISSSRRTTFFGDILGKSGKQNVVKDRIMTAKRKANGKVGNSPQNEAQRESANDGEHETNDLRSQRPIVGTTEPVAFSERAMQPTASSKRHSLVADNKGDEDRRKTAVRRDPFKEATGKESFFDLYNEVASSSTTVESVTPAGSSPIGSDGVNGKSTGQRGESSGKSEGETASVAEKNRVRKWLRSLGLDHLYSTFAANGLLSLSSIEFLDHQDLTLMSVPKDDTEKLLRAIQAFSTTTTEFATHAVEGRLNSGGTLALSSSEDTVAAFTEAIDGETFQVIFDLWNSHVAPIQQSMTSIDNEDTTRAYFDLRIYAATMDSPTYTASEKRVFLRDFRNFLATEAASKLLTREPSLLVFAGLPFITDSAAHPELRQVHTSAWRSDVRQNATKLLRRIFLHPQHKDAGAALKNHSSAQPTDKQYPPSDGFLQVIEKLKRMEELAASPTMSVSEGDAESPAVRAINNLFGKKVPSLSIRDGATPTSSARKVDETINNEDAPHDAPVAPTSAAPRMIIESLDSNAGGLDEIDDDDGSSSSSSLSPLAQAERAT